MRVVVLAWLLFLMGCGCGGAEIARSQRVATIGELQDATVALVQRDMETFELRPYCSGVWLEERLFLTAAHCVDEGDSVEFSAFQGQLRYSLPARVMKRNVELDLALVVALEGAMHSVVRLATEAPVIGDQVYIVGHTIGLPWSYTPGWVGGLRENALDVPGHQLQFFSAMGPGNSGGGVFDKQGNLLAICQFMSTRVPQLGFGARAFSIREFIES